MERIRNERGCFLFRKHDSRYKFIKPSSSAIPTRQTTKKKATKPETKEEKKTSKTKEVKSRGSLERVVKQKKGWFYLIGIVVCCIHTLVHIERLDRVELYYFDHGNAGYFCTTDCPPQLSSDYLAQQTTDCATKFWAEFYGSIHIAVAILIAFLLQTFRFFMYSVVRPTAVGLMQIIADYGVKPILTVLFNGFLQPPLILGLNVFNSVADMLEPLARTVAHFIRPAVELCQAIRLVEISHYHHGVDGDLEMGNREGIPLNGNVDAEEV